MDLRFPSEAFVDSSVSLNQTKQTASMLKPESNQLICHCAHPKSETCWKIVLENDAYVSH